MQQYFEIKDKYREYILMYRLGDFYEMFFDDAKTASAELELTLTGRDCGEAERAPMCGVPYHAVEGYIGKLVGKGYKVAICEQLEDPASAKGIVKRDVIRMITPGTLTEASLLDEMKNNYKSSSGVYMSLILEKIFGGMKRDYLKNGAEGGLDDADAGRIPLVKEWLDNKMAENITQKMRGMAMIIRGIKHNMKKPDEETLKKEVQAIIQNAWLNRMFPSEVTDDQKMAKASYAIPSAFILMMNDNSAKFTRRLKEIIKFVLDEDKLNKGKEKISKIYTGNSA